MPPDGDIIGKMSTGGMRILMGRGVERLPVLEGKDKGATPNECCETSCTCSVSLLLSLSIKPSAPAIVT